MILESIPGVKSSIGQPTRPVDNFSSFFFPKLLGSGNPFLNALSCTYFCNELLMEAVIVFLIVVKMLVIEFELWIRMQNDLITIRKVCVTIAPDACHFTQG